MDFGILKRSNPKSGRRARQQNTTTADKEETFSQPTKEISQPFTKAEEPRAEIPRPSRRANTALSGWGESTTNKDVFEDARFQLNDDNEDSDLNEAIQIIPDIDEVHEEDLMTQMAAPPTVSTSQIATYHELDSDYKKSSFLMLDNEIDLKLLAKHLLPESEVQEQKQSWEWERLFADVSSKINPESLNMKA